MFRIVNESLELRKLLNIRGSVSVGQGITVYEVTESAIGMHSRLESEEVLFALVLGDALFVHTTNGESIVIDIGNEFPLMAGRMTAEVPHHSMLHTSRMIVAGNQGLRVGLGHEKNQLHLHWLGRYGVDDGGMDRRMEYEWRGDEGLVS